MREGLRVGVSADKPPAASQAVLIEPVVASLADEDLEVTDFLVDEDEPEPPPIVNPKPPPARP